MNNQIAENLRYLLWQKGVAKEEWATQLAQWARCDRFHAVGLLTGAEKLTSDEQQHIERVGGISQEALILTRLLTSQEIVRGNLMYLLGGLEHGEQKRFAEHIGASVVTVSRWRTGEQLPRSNGIEALHKYFELPADINLEEDALFLSLSPVGDKQRKEWLCERVQQLGTYKLNKIFPALEILLRDP